MPEPPKSHASDYMANERTYLAWIRTAVSLIGLGFVLAKFSLYLHEFFSQVDPQKGHRLGLSMPLGEGLMAVGALLALLAAWRYRAVNRAIRQGEVEPDDRMVYGLTALVLLLGLAAIVLMLTQRA